MTEFKIIQQSAPGAIAFNYEELKAEITEKAKVYETLVYTEENIGDAKADRANLNKLKTALNDERKNREKEFMKPFEEFKKQVNEIIAIIDKPVTIIDKQVKEFEENEKAKKREKIGQIWEETNKPQWMGLAQIWNDKWLNKSFTEKAIREEIDQALKKVEEDLTAIGSFQSFSFEAMETYKNTLDLGKALAEGQRLADLQKRKEEAEEKARAKAAEQMLKVPYQQTEEPQPVGAEEQPTGQWVKFEVYLTTVKALALREFLKEQGIEFRPIKN